MEKNLHILQKNWILWGLVLFGFFEINFSDLSMSVCLLWVTYITCDV